MIRTFSLAAVSAAALLAGSASAQTAAPAAAQAPVDYKQDAAWLCRPGRKDACAVDLTTTVVAADGKTRVERFQPARNARIDCFYVYPTVSTDPTPNSDMSIDQAERRVVEAQLARFASQCRTFAPMYRQVTLAALRAGMTGQVMPGVDRNLGYNDVKAAWNDYLARDNGGRGVVLIGHSQGSGVLKRLLQEEIEGKPVQKQLVSALLIGTNVGVPAGADVGGELKSTPLCRSASQTGCLVSYVTFREDVPPPANSRFGKITTAGQVAACVNPAAPAGGRATLRPYLSNTAIVSADAPGAPVQWTKSGPVNTSFVATPGLLTAECVNKDGFSYLSVRTEADPADPRIDRIPGDVVANGTTLTDWGLHLVDMHVAMGDLVALVGSQSKAYLARR
jgi:hypothetical protein